MADCGRLRPSRFARASAELLGVRYPIVQAPMGWIARAQLASAVSNAGGLGIIETSSGELDVVRDEIRKMRDLTDKPFGVNIAQLFVRDPASSTSSSSRACASSPPRPAIRAKYTRTLKDAGLTVFHVVPHARAARSKAVDAGVDGLVVEGGEGGGFKNPRDVATMVLLPLVCSKVDVPIIAAGGICDGPTMAAAFALGAEGVQMGTRMVSAAESPVHDNWKAGHRRRGRDRHRVPQPLQPARPARAAHRAEPTRLEREDHVGFDVFGRRDGPLLRRRHGGVDRARRPGRRPHRRGQAGRPDHRRDDRRLPRDDRRSPEVHRASA